MKTYHEVELSWVNHGRGQIDLSTRASACGSQMSEGGTQVRGNTREGRNQPEHLYVITYMSPLVRYQEISRN